jgi:hypothetical protein
MRTSAVGLMQPRPKVSRRNESVQKGTKRKGRIEFIGESSQLILIERMTRAQSKEAAEPSIVKSTVTSLIVWRLRMANHIRRGLDSRSLIMRDLVLRGVKERSLIDQGITETSLTMMSLDTALMTQM